MCFHLSDSLINWWSRSSPLAFSYAALYPSFPVFKLLVNLCVFSGSSARSKQSLNLLRPDPLWIFYLFQPDWIFLSYFIFVTPALLSARRPFRSVVILFLPSSTLPCLLVCGFWAMLSSPTVILQPYGLPVYPQTTTCYPSIVQVKYTSWPIQSMFVTLILLIYCENKIHSQEATWHPLKVLIILIRI